MCFFINTINRGIYTWLFKKNIDKVLNFYQSVLMKRLKGALPEEHLKLNSLLLEDKSLLKIKSYLRENKEGYK